MADSPLPVSSPLSYTTEVPKRDVEKAKQLLAEAGYPNGIKLDLYYANAIPGLAKFAEAYAVMASDAGININLIRTPDDSFWDEIWLKKPFITAGWAAYSPLAMLSIAYRTNAPWNESHWRRPDYDALLDKIATTMNADARIAYYKAAQKMLAEEGGEVIPVILPTLSILRDGCTGYEPHDVVHFMNFRNLECK
jgi:peptide/nickel transport system substrate-binding protein